MGLASPNNVQFVSLQAMTRYAETNINYLVIKSATIFSVLDGVEMKTLWLFPTEKALLEAAKQLASRRQRRILLLVIVSVSISSSLARLSVVCNSSEDGED